MKHLLKADFYRLFKNKLALISLIIAAVLPLLTALLFLGLREMLVAMDPSSKDSVAFVMNARMLISSSFSFTNNFGIVLPVFAAIIIMGDVNSGTIRNKVILGYRRRQIFASHYLVTLAYCLSLIAIYAAMTALWSVVILGANPVSAEHAVSLVYFYILGLLSFAVVSAVATCLSLLTLNNAGSILLTLVFCMGFGLLAQLIGAFDYSRFEHVVNFLPNFVVNAFASKEISLTMFLEALGGSLVFGGAFYVLGTIGFAKRDLK